MTDTPEEETPQNDITTLFSIDPLKLTNENVDQIIEEMRKKRHLFQAGGSVTKAKPKTTPKQQAALKLDLDLDL